MQIDRLEQEVSNSEEMENVLAERKKETIQDICDSFEALCSRLRERRDILLTDLESTFLLKMDLIRKL